MTFRLAEIVESNTVVKVVGVGGGGGNSIDRMVSNNLRGVELITADTDMQSLNKSLATIPMKLGANVTKGLGTGGDPVKGMEAALESIEDLRKTLKGSDLVFVTAGLGGGTGSGAAPVVARVAKELGALTAAVVTKPFSFEGAVRMQNAQQGWEELRKYTDAIISVPNDSLLALMEKKSTLYDMFWLADTVLYHAVKGITDLINFPGYISVDFADLKAVMRDTGTAVIGFGSAVGENRAMEAAENAINTELLEHDVANAACGLLINIAATEESLTMVEFMEASVFIREKVDSKKIFVVIGAVIDESLGDEFRVTVIATGVEKLPQQDNNNSSFSQKKNRQKECANKEMRTASVDPVPTHKVLPTSDFVSRPFNQEANSKDKNSELSDEQLAIPTYLRKPKEDF